MINVSCISLETFKFLSASQILTRPSRSKKGWCGNIQCCVESTTSVQKYGLWSGRNTQMGHIATVALWPCSGRNVAVLWLKQFCFISFSFFIRLVMKSLLSVTHTRDRNLGGFKSGFICTQRGSNEQFKKKPKIQTLICVSILLWKGRSYRNWHKRCWVSTTAGWKSLWQRWNEQPVFGKHSEVINESRRLKENGG